MRKILDEIRICLSTPGCLPALCWGQPGTGKTQCILMLAQQLGYNCGRWSGKDADGNVEVLRPAERGEGALGVVPVPSEDRSTLKYPLPEWAARMRDTDEPCLLFLDEISSCPPALQPSIMGLALDGVIAGYRLPDRVKRIAAANPTDQAAGGWELALALSNRFVHLRWETPTASEWIDWLIGTHFDIPGWSQAKALGAAFIRRFPAALCEDTSKLAGREPMAFTTPRTWECALRLLAACRSSGRMDVYPALAEGTLGPAIAMQGAGGGAQGAWLVWLKDNDLPDPEELLEDPDLFQHDAKRPDRTFATLFAVAEAALAEVNGKKLTTDQRGKRWRQGWSVLARAMEQKIGKDLALLPAKVMVDVKRRPKAPHGEDGQKVCKVLGVFIDLYQV